ncbi:hypothetical protein ACJZ2D_004014 [Fusarium nematophilum]
MKRLHEQVRDLDPKPTALRFNRISSNIAEPAQLASLKASEQPHFAKLLEIIFSQARVLKRSEEGKARLTGEAD